MWTTVTALDLTGNINVTPTLHTPRSLNLIHSPSSFLPPCSPVALSLLLMYSLSLSPHHFLSLSPCRSFKLLFTECNFTSSRTCPCPFFRSLSPFPLSLAIAASHFLNLISVSFPAPRPVGPSPPPQHNSLRLTYWETERERRWE